MFTTSTSLSLMSKLRTERWLAKTVVLLIPLFGDPVAGVESWLDAYHGQGRHQTSIQTFPITGTIRAALAIDKSADTEVHLRIIGTHGQLPNLDLVNLAAFAFRGGVVIEEYAVSFLLLQPSSERSRPPLLFVCCEPFSSVFASAHGDGYFNRLGAMASFMTAMLHGPSGPHGAFLRWAKGEEAEEVG
jgi:hypothetical protein